MNENLDFVWQKVEKELEAFLTLHNKKWGDLMEDEQGQFVMVENDPEDGNQFSKVYFEAPEDL